MPFKPYSDNVLVRRREATTEAAGGLRLPQSAQEDAQEADVIAVGPGFLTEQGNRIPVACQPNDHILFRKYAGTEHTINGEKLLILREQEIIGQIITHGYSPANPPVGREEKEPTIG